MGEAIGNLNYIENIGDSINFNFDLRSETFGGVSVSEWWTNIGMSSPIFHRNGSNIGNCTLEAKEVLFINTII